MKIAVLFGGNSSERDVSIASGIKVTKSLKEAGHNVLAVDTFRGVLSDTEVQTLLSRGIAPEPPSPHDLEVVKAKTGGIVQPSYFTDADVLFLAFPGGAGGDRTGKERFFARWVLLHRCAPRRNRPPQGKNFAETPAWS